MSGSRRGIYDEGGPAPASPPPKILRIEAILVESDILLVEMEAGRSFAATSAFLDVAQRLSRVVRTPLAPQRRP